MAEGLYPEPVTDLWALASPLPVLPEGEVHLWKACLSLPADRLGCLRATLSDDERERADRFVIHLVRDRFIAARGALRDILGRYLGQPAPAIRFAYAEHGKPELADDRTGLCFNLSHTRDMALYAMARNRRIGVDIECLDRPVYNDRLKLAERFFSEAEHRTLRMLPEDRQDAAFLRCWTRKEAFVKAIGDGLTCPLNEFDVTLSDREPPAITATRWDPLEAGRWAMVSMAPENGYIAAVVVEAPLPRFSMWQWA